jgi:hypothetical protein
VQELPPDTHYAPPVANECECNTVVYSLISACADCQGAFYSTWADWAVNCTGTRFLSSFPEAIPAGTAVPHWAYLDIVGTGRYSPLAAQQDVGVESAASTRTTAARTSTSTRIVPTTTTAITATSGDEPSTTPISSSNDSSSKKKTNIGPIVGGVVGGVAVIALIVGIVLFAIRSRKSHAAPSAAYLDSKVPPLATPPPMGQYAQPGPFAMQQTGYNVSGVMAPPSTTTSPPPGSQYSTDPFITPQARPYDPSDPSTFPTDVNATAGFPVANSQGYPSQSGSPVYPSQPGSPGSVSYSQTTQYRGAPQV